VTRYRIRLAAHRERLRGAREDGFTLTELVVACMIMGLVTSGGFLVLTGALRTSQGTKDRLTDINNARLAVSSMSRSLRTAVLPSQLDDNTSGVTAAFIQGGATSVSFYADINNPVTLPVSGNTRYGPSQVSYTVTGPTTNQVLTQTIQPPNLHDVNDHNYQYCTPGSAGCVVYTTVLARGVDASASKPLFVYYQADGTVLGTLSAGNLDDVDSIDIRVGMDNVSTSPMGTSSFTTRVSLPNHESLLRQQNGAP
jgi:prepilin-type N-terminal cleavage/methylation domain-containing protein